MLIPYLVSYLLACNLQLTLFVSDKSVKVHAIYRLSRAGEEDRVQELNLENRMLLWHGSGVPNFISILSRGLLICPPEAPITGHLFGEVSFLSFSFSLFPIFFHI